MNLRVVLRQKYSALAPALNERSRQNNKISQLFRYTSIVAEDDIETLLKKLNLVENRKLKRAAVLLFGKTPQRFYPQAVVKIGKFLSESAMLATDLIKGNLFKQMEDTLEILRSKYLISEIRFEGIHRRDILEYPYEALREGIINALIHRDYLGTSNIQVRAYPDKLLIMNEGSCLLKCLLKH